MRTININYRTLSTEFTVIITAIIINNILILSLAESTVNSSNIVHQQTEMMNIINTPNHHNLTTTSMHKTILTAGKIQFQMKIHPNLGIRTIQIEITEVINYKGHIYGQ